MNFKKSLKSVATFVLGAGMALNSMFVAPRIKAGGITKKFYDQLCKDYQDKPMILRILLLAFYMTQSRELSRSSIDKLDELSAFLENIVSESKIAVKQRMGYVAALASSGKLSDSDINKIRSGDYTSVDMEINSIVILDQKNKLSTPEQRKRAERVEMIVSFLVSLENIPQWVNQVNMICDICKKTAALRYSNPEDTTSDTDKQSMIAENLHKIANEELVKLDEDRREIINDETLAMLKAYVKAGFTAANYTTNHLSRVTNLTDASLKYECESLLAQM